MVHAQPAELVTGMCMLTVYCARADIDIKAQIGCFWWDLEAVWTRNS